MCGCAHIVYILNFEKIECIHSEALFGKTPSKICGYKYIY